jgi:hypothetical protein
VAKWGKRNQRISQLHPSPRFQKAKWNGLREVENRQASRRRVNATPDYAAARRGRSDHRPDVMAGPPDAWQQRASMLVGSSSVSTIGHASAADWMTAASRSPDRPG